MTQAQIKKLHTILVKLETLEFSGVKSGTVRDYLSEGKNRLIDALTAAERGK